MFYKIDFLIPVPAVFYVSGTDQCPIQSFLKQVLPVSRTRGPSKSPNPKHGKALQTELFCWSQSLHSSNHLDLFEHNAELRTTDVHNQWHIHQLWRSRRYISDTLEIQSQQYDSLRRIHPADGLRQLNSFGLG